MEYQEALSIGKQRRAEATLALSIHVRQRAEEVCAVKPAKGGDPRSPRWEPVGEENFKEICYRMNSRGDWEAYLVVVDEDGVTKACTQKSYPLRIVLQMAQAMPLKVYMGPGGMLAGYVNEEAPDEPYGVPHGLRL
jgi:hypothetical protein